MLQSAKEDNSNPLGFGDWYEADSQPGGKRHLQKKHDTENADLIPGLQDDVGILCLARIPLCCRRSISSVCRKWRNVFHKERFWDVRLELSRTEEVLLLWAYSPFRRDIWFGFYPSTKTWFQLPIMPNDGRAKGYSTFAVMAGKLFVIRGCDIVCGHYESRSLADSCTVFYFDFKVYQWRMTTPLNIPRRLCKAGVINDRLYVCGGVQAAGGGLEATVEVYNQSTQTWKLISSMKIPGDVQSSIAIDNKFYVVYHQRWSGLTSEPIFEGAVYDPRRDEWSEMPDGLNFGWSGRPVAFDGKFCIRRCNEIWRADGIYETSVLVYNPSKDAWDLIHGRIAPEDDLAEHRSKCRMDDGTELVNIGESLFTLHKSRYGPGLRFEIRDLAQNLVAAKSFSPTFVEDLQDVRLLDTSREDFADDDVTLIYQLMTL